jgi:hypothetical protein
MHELSMLLLHGQIAELLMDAPNVLTEHNADDGLPPESEAVRDQAVLHDASVASQVSMVMAATAAEGLAAVGATFAMIHPTAAHLPTLRMVIETSARIHWIVSGDTAASRAKRAWLQLLVSRGLEEKAQRNSLNPEVMSTAAERLAATIGQISDLLGEPPDMTPSRPEHWRIGDEQMPAFTDAVEALVTSALPESNADGKSMYRLYSMISHPGATTWAFLEMDNPAGTAELRPDLRRLAGESLSAAYLWIHVATEVLGYHNLPGRRASRYHRAIQDLSRLANQGPT